MMKTGFLLAAFFGWATVLQAQLMAPKNKFTIDDTLRGSVTDYRKGWDVIKYELEVSPNIPDKTINGKNKITYKVLMPFATMQIDLQQPMVVDSVLNERSEKLDFTRQNNVCLVTVNQKTQPRNKKSGNTVTIFYHGTPIEAIKPPWDGGVIWKSDDQGNPWIATACQGLGASVWWPCKDYQGDEPDEGMTIKITAPDTLSAISNGRLQQVAAAAPGYKTWTWQVKNPINNYAVTMNIGNYTQWTDTLQGEAGTLDLQYWVLDYNLKRAKEQFAQVKPMLRSHEYWFGRYPFYEDSYKLVETPFLGMEHQSAVAYGNKYQDGYLGTDLSGTGWGLKWDFIIIHESGHEWFGNNITANEIADMWVHEGFTNYSETLFTETYFGIEAANEYNYGTRKRIRNDINIIGYYGVNKEGSGDMYYKGGNLMHLIRHSINDDSLFRNILRGLNKTFYHQTVTSQQVEEYISQQSKMDLSTVFDQYLRTTQVPALEYYVDQNKNLYYRWSNCIQGFNLSLALKNNDSCYRLSPTTRWQKVAFNPCLKETWRPAEIEKNYYILIKNTSKKPAL